MKIALVLVFVMLCGVLQAAANVHKCNPQLIEAIEKHWGCNVPGNIIATSIANGKEVVVGTTEGFYPDTTRCVYGYFHPDGLMFNVIPHNGPAVAKDVNLEEGDGTITDQDTGVVRYQIYNKGGVTAFLICLPNGGSVGSPKALIKVRASNFKQKNVDEAKALLKKLGKVDVVKKYPSECKLKL